MAHVHNEIHKAFNKLIEELIEKYIHSIGVTTMQFITALSSGGKRRLTKQIIDFILCCDDFTVFMKMMRSRNIELEQKALKTIQQGKDLPPLVPTKAIRRKSSRRHKNLSGVEAEMLELALNNSLKQAEEDDLKRALDISMQYPPNDNTISAFGTGDEKCHAKDLNSEPTLTIGSEETRMSELIYPRSVSQTPNTEYDLEDV